ncbi:MAG: secondary thiamine-phosphate synthase enzyme YjbQ [Gemmataceae bacterium]
MDTFTVTTTQRNQLVEITAQVRHALRRRGLREGVGFVYCPHTTAAITINENADPDVVHDMLLWLERAIPHVQPGFLHGEGNSDSHVKASLVGSSATVIVDKGDLVLGRWQGVFLCEFDGPRSRNVCVRWLGA